MSNPPDDAPPPPPAGTDPAARPTTPDARRVTPKWLGKKIGRFRLQGLLGQGAVGRVFRAEDSILHRRVALKVISIHAGDGQIHRGADQFLTEARAAASLEHPNVVQIYEAGESGNLCYIAMELLEGGSLKDLVDAAGPMDPGRACVLVADAADALAAAHGAGIVHRDVKPANLMLTRQGRCKVTDFGLATFGDVDSVATERAAGTPQFAAPEVIRGTSADDRSDIYSLGATLYYLLAGRPPYTARTRAEVLRKHIDEPVPDLRAIRPGLPESLAAAVERAMAKDPGQRFPSATQFARVLRVQAIPAGPVPTWTGGPANATDTIGGASVMNLIGLSAVAGGSSGLAAGDASAPLSSGDLLGGGGGGRRRPAATAAATAAAAGPVAHYATPPARTYPWWRGPAGLVVVGLAGVVAALAVVALVRTTPPAATYPAITPSPPAVAVTPADPGTLPPAVVTPAAVAPAAVTPARPTGPDVAAGDVARLTRVANGTDADHHDGRVTVAGTVSTAAPSASGKVVRLEFAGTPFVVVYFDGNGLYARMDEAFGGTDGGGLAGKAVRVTGQVKMFHGAPEIVLTSPAQVTVVGGPATKPT